MPVPILCGIGHQVDHCLIDDLSRSFKTPTAVGQEISKRVRAFVTLLDEVEIEVERASSQFVNEERNELDHLMRRIS